MNGPGLDARVIRTRRDVGNAAAALLLERGWEAVTHAEVARSAGFSRATVYAHWPRQLDLMRSAIEVFCDAGTHPPLTGDLRTDVRASLLDFARDLGEGHLDRLLGGLIERSQQDEEMQGLRRRLYDSGTAALRTALETSLEPQEAAVCLSLLTGGVFMWVSFTGRTATDAFVDDLIDRVLPAVTATDRAASRPPAR